MIDIKKYIKLTREERRSHLKLDEPCIERGGHSTHFKGLLAAYLNTTIPSGRICCCHACGNPKCSNPNHLYWGTDYENIIIDGKEHGTFVSLWEKLVNKYGYEGACALRRKGDKSKGGKANIKPKTEEHKQKIRDGVNKHYSKRCSDNQVD